jgi:hypothetical protein
MDDDAIATALTRAVSRYRFEPPLGAPTTGRVGRLRLIGAGISLALVAGLVGALLRPSLPLGPSTAFADWQAAPMTPTAAVTAAAPARCGMATFGLPTSVPVIIDQRGSAAAIMLATQSDVVTCFVVLDSSGNVAAAVSGAGHRGPANGQINVLGGLTVPAAGGDPGVTVINGTVASTVASVQVMEAGVAVTATVHDGFFLAWWPGTDTASDVSALDAAGAVIAHAPSPAP